MKIVIDTTPEELRRFLIPYSKKVNDPETIIKKVIHEENQGLRELSGELVLRVPHSEK